MTQPNLKINPQLQPPDFAPITGTESARLSAVTVAPVDEQITESEVRELEETSLDDQKFLSRSIQAYEAADKYFNANIRPRLNDSIAAYKSKHTANSTLGFDSNPDNNLIYRPKTRTIINKYKAAAGGSFFSNLDTISIEPENQADKAEAISAGITKALVQYRLRKSIPWFQTLIGAFDDALTQGVAVAYTRWEIKRRRGRLIERPVVELIPLENIRFDPSADWCDIVNSTPYLILLRPTYIVDLKEQMASGEYIQLEDRQISASSQQNNTTAKERGPNDTDPDSEREQSGKLQDYQIALVQIHIHRIGGEDWIWTTLNNAYLLTRPKPLEEVHFSGERPFVIGTADVEPHNPFNTPLPILLEPTQTEMNLLANQRRTNVDMAMNRKWRVDPEAHDEFDPNALLNNEVGSVIFAGKDGVEPLTTPDVTASAYQEQVVLDKDFADLAGDFQPTSDVLGRNPSDTFRTQQLLNSNANLLVEMRLKTFVQTFAEPVLRKIVELEQHYETDETLIALVGQQAGLFMRSTESGGMEWSEKARQIFGPVPPQSGGSAPGESPSAVAGPNAAAVGGGGSTPPLGAPPAAPGSMTPNPALPSRALPPGINISDLLARDLVVVVNVGLNATDPQLKLQRFMAALNTVLGLLSNPMSVAFDMDEIYKEIFALCGYSDGRRFQNNEGEGSQVRVLKQQLMMAMQQLKLKTAEHQLETQSREKIAALNAQTKIQIEAAKLKQDAAVLNSENARFVAEHSADRHDALIEQNNPALNPNAGPAGPTAG